jgi:transposase-like protein
MWYNKSVFKKGGFDMAGAGISRNKFTAEQVEILRNNPYVQNVSEDRITFTVEFKEEFWRLYKEDGMSAYDILSRMGVDYYTLGSSRVQGLTNNIKKQYRRCGDFTERRRTFMPEEVLPPDKEITRLRTEVEYLRQEQEFLKKIFLTGKDGKSK